MEDDEPYDGCLLHPEEALGRALLGDDILEVPDAVPVDHLLPDRADLGQDPALEAVHAEQQVGVVLRVDGDEGVLPGDVGEGAGHPGKGDEGDEYNEGDEDNKEIMMKTKMMVKTRKV